jgi:colanic acid/amylovoran biosynthesis glycosyltransferase
MGKRNEHTFTKRRLKIAFIIDMYPTISTFILNQISGLIDLGHEVYVFPKFRGPSYLPSLHDDRLRGFVIFPEEYVINRKLKYKRVLKIILKHILKTPIPIFNVLNVFKFGRKALNFSLLFEIAPFLGKSWDIAQVHYGDYANRALLLKEAGWNVKVITMFHGYDIRKGILEGSEIYSDLKSKGDIILSICDYNYSNLINFGFEKHKIIKHSVGIDTSFFQYHKRNFVASKRIIILSVGRLVWEKGYKYALDAMAILKANKANFEYRIIGEGNERGTLVNYRSKLGLEDNVNFLGLKNQSEIKLEMYQAHIFLLPSVAEALPLVIMEAASTGLPIVASDVGSVKDEIENGITGIIVPAKDSKSIAKGLIQISNNWEEWKYRGLDASKCIRNQYDIKLLNEKLERIYLNCAAN